jgi:hypothetical protein
MKETILNRILVALPAILFIPQGMWAANYNITIAGISITDTNAGNVFGDGKVSFTPATATTPNILRLNNYKKTDNDAKIVSGLDNLTIEFSGSNVLGRNSRYYGIIQSTVSTAVLTLKGISGSTASSTLELNSFNDNSVIEGFGRVDLDGAYLNYYQPFSYGSFTNWNNVEKKGYVIDDGLLHGLVITTDVCYPLWISDDGYSIYQMTDASSVVSGATFSVNGSTNTLTLNNANLARIVSGLDNLTIDLVGDNSIVNLYDAASVVRSINEDGVLTFTKSGSSGSLALQNASNSNYSIVSGFKSIAYNGLYLNTSVPPQYKSNSLVNAINDNVINSATINSIETYPLWVNGLQVTSANAGSIENGNPGAAAGIGISENVAGKGCSVKYESGVLEFDNVNLTATNNAIVTGLADLTVKIKGLNYFKGANNYFTSINGSTLTFSGDGEDAELEMVNHVGFEGFSTIDYDKVYFGGDKGLNFIKYLKAPTMRGTEVEGGLDVEFQGDDASGISYWYSIDYAGTALDVSNTQLSTTVLSYGGPNVQTGTMTMSGPGVVTAYAKYVYVGGTNSSTQGIAKTGKYFSFAEKELTTPYKASISAPSIVPTLPSGVTVTYYDAMATTASVNSINSSTGVVSINGLTTSPDIFGATFSYPLNHDGYTILNSLRGQTDLSLGSFKLMVTAKALTADMVTLNPTSFTYTGAAHAPTVTVKDGDKTLTQGTDYTLTNNGGTVAGDYSFTVVGVGNYSGTISKTFSISKAAGAVSYASVSVSKTYGDGAFTNSLTLTGDGAVSYSSSDASVASVNATTGEVTIVGSGSAVITATVTDGSNYTYASRTAAYTLTVGTAGMNVTATGYSGTYDGQSHGITLTVPDGATVKYGTTEGSYTLTASPTYMDAGSYIVYYEVTKTGYTTVTGSATVTISKAQATVKYNINEFTTKIDEPFDRPYVTLDPPGLKLTYWSSDNDVAIVDAQTGEVTLIAPGKVNIYAEFAGDENYNSASDYYILTVLQRDIEPIDEDVVIVWKDEDFIATDADGKPVEKKLNNTVIYDILFTLDISGDPSVNDGYDETEHCVVLNHPISNREVDNIIFSQLAPGTDAYAEEYTGLTFKVPAGKGYVIIDAQTDGEYQMMVKIGDLVPVAFDHTGREKDSVLYSCSEPTWVYVYNGGKVGEARQEAMHRAKKQVGHVKIYSVTRSSSEGSGIERINSEAIGDLDRWYDLQGNRIERPKKKGIYILRGQKVIVR